MTAKIYGTILIVICLINCGQPTKTEQSELTKADSIKEESQVTKTESADTTNTNDNWDSDCIRGQAQSVVKKSVYPNTTFKLNEDNRTGTETVGLKNGDKLVINNWGCEYYALTFRFETNRFKADTTDIDYWIGKALFLMKEIENGLDAPLDIPGGTPATKNYLKEKGEYKLGEWIMYGDTIIRNIVTIDRVQKLPDNKYAVEITYSIGPL